MQKGLGAQAHSDGGIRGEALISFQGATEGPCSPRGPSEESTGDCTLPVGSGGTCRVRGGESRCGRISRMMAAPVQGGRGADPNNDCDP